MDSIRFDIQPYVGVNETRNMHMLASKLIKNKNRQIVLSIGDEGYNITKNGLEIAVKQICDYNLIPYENVIFESGDALENSKFFKHRYIGYNGDAVRINLEKLNQKFNLPKSFNYGLFYARPDDCRLYSFYKHISSNNRLKGIATMHFDPTNYSNLDTLEHIANFVIDYPDSWALTKKELPYSLLHFTGPKEFNIAMRKKAKINGFKLNQYGLYNQKTGGLVKNIKTEQDIFEKIDFEYKAPDERDI